MSNSSNLQHKVFHLPLAKEALIRHYTCLTSSKLNIQWKISVPFGKSYSLSPMFISYIKNQKYLWMPCLSNDGHIASKFIELDRFNVNSPNILHRLFTCMEFIETFQICWMPVKRIIGYYNSFGLLCWETIHRPDLTVSLTLRARWDSSPAIKRSQRWHRADIVLRIVLNHSPNTAVLISKVNQWKLIVRFNWKKDKRHVWHLKICLCQ